jgi:hypothetical protein
MRRIFGLLALASGLTFGLTPAAEAQFSVSLGNPYSGQAVTLGSTGGGNLYVSPGGYGAYGNTYGNMGYGANGSPYGYGGSPYGYNTTAYNSAYGYSPYYGTGYGHYGTTYSSGYSGYASPYGTTYHSGYAGYGSPYYGQIYNSGHVGYGGYGYGSRGWGYRWR